MIMHNTFVLLMVNTDSVITAHMSGLISLESTPEHQASLAAVGKSCAAGATWSCSNCRAERTSSLFG